MGARLYLSRKLQRYMKHTVNFRELEELERPELDRGRTWSNEYVEYLHDYTALQTSTGYIRVLGRVF